MSNTTPQSPDDNPVDEPAPTPSVPNDSEKPSDAPADSETPDVPTYSATEADDAQVSSATEQPVASTRPPSDDIDDDVDDPSIAEVAPVASSSHISGSSDTGQTRAYEPVATGAVADSPAADAPTAPTTPTTDSSATESPTTAYQPVTPAYAPQPMYVTAPQQPKPKGNRGAGILIALLATVAFAVVSALVVLVIFLITKRTPDIAVRDFLQYVSTASYVIPIIFFALAFFLLIAIVNRGGWWAYILGAFFVAVIVYFAYIGGVLLTIQAWQYSPAEVSRIMSQLWANPLTIGTAIVAREVPIWFGVWIAARGRKVRERNADAQSQYERTLAEGPQPIQRGN